MPENVTILGDGAMATVCSILLSQGGHRVTIWGAFEDAIEQLLQDRENRRFLPGVRVPLGVRLTSNEADCFTGAGLIVSAIPTQYMRSIWQRVKAHVPAGVPIVSVTKGVENSTLLRPTQIIADVLGNGRGKGDRHLSHVPRDGSPDQKVPVPFSPMCDWPLAALSGPTVAGELARYLPATAVAASPDAALAESIQRIFSTQWFRLYTNSDIIGVELAGAVKNVVAIAAGIIDGLGAGSNAKAALVTRGLVEITRLGIAMGAAESTFGGLAGLGDLITTCVSPEGRNRSVGEQIGKGRKLDDILSQMQSVAEGVPTTRSVVELAARHGVEMPITQAVHRVLFENQDVFAAISDLMTRDPKPE